MFPRVIADGSISSQYLHGRNLGSLRIFVSRTEGMCFSWMRSDALYRTAVSKPFQQRLVVSSPESCSKVTQWDTSLQRLSTYMPSREPIRGKSCSGLELELLHCELRNKLLSTLLVRF